MYFFDYFVVIVGFLNIFLDICLEKFFLFLVVFGFDFGGVFFVFELYEDY